MTSGRDHGMRSTGIRRASIVAGNQSSTDCATMVGSHSVFVGSRNGSLATAGPSCPAPGRALRMPSRPPDPPRSAGSDLAPEPAARSPELQVNSRPLPRKQKTPSNGVCDVRPEGFEPPTLGSEDRCSIQLSYGRAPAAYQLRPTPTSGAHRPPPPFRGRFPPARPTRPTGRARDSPYPYPGPAPAPGPPAVACRTSRAPRW